MSRLFTGAARTRFNIRTLVHASLQRFQLILVHNQIFAQVQIAQLLEPFERVHVNERDAIVIEAENLQASQASEHERIAYVSDAIAAQVELFKMTECVEDKRVDFFDLIRRQAQCLEADKTTEHVQVGEQRQIVRAKIELAQKLQTHERARVDELDLIVAHVESLQFGRVFEQEFAYSIEHVFLHVEFSQVVQVAERFAVQRNNAVRGEVKLFHATQAVQEQVILKDELIVGKSKLTFLFVFRTILIVAP